MCRAINQHKQLRILYTDEYKDRREYRIVNPHLVGINYSDHPVLRAWYEPELTQNIRGDKKGFRVYLIDNIIEILIMESYFYKTGYKYTPNDKDMKIIICKVPVIP